MTKKLAILALPLLAAACAKSPDAIAPVSMGNAFAGASCQQASADLAAERQNLTALEDAHRALVAAGVVTTRARVKAGAVEAAPRVRVTCPATHPVYVEGKGCRK